MAVHESHTIKISGRITVKDLAELVQKAQAAGASPDSRVTLEKGSGHQRDETPDSLTVIIAGSGL